MNRERPTINEHGDEEHPAFAIMGASRVSHSPPGATLFDSEIRHQHYVSVKIGHATRNRHLNRDWIRKDKEIIELIMSEAQWASFVSSMNSGDGVPATIRWHGREEIPGIEHEPRMQESMDEVRGAGTKALAQIKEAFAAVEEKPNKGNLRHLKAMIDNAPANMVFAAESLTEHTENVVQKARADIEAMVRSHAEHIGIEPGDISLPLLEQGGEEDQS